jgi:hypothetical protein
MNTTMSAREAINHITEQATFKAKGDDRRVNLAVGKHGRQGDIYICRVADTHARGEEQKDRQLAQGESRGSRHIAEAPAKVYVGTTAPANALNSRLFLGPCVVSESEFMISHPEHANVILTAGTYQIVHQMDALTLKRVQD